MLITKLLTRRAVPVFFSLAGLVAIARPILALHSFGVEYDATKPITLSGVVTKVEWTNPHTHFYMDVTDAKGHVANWKFQGYNPSVLYRNGWKRDVSLKPGDHITVTGWRSRDGTNWGQGREVTLADGTKLLWGPPSGTGDGGSTPAVDVK
jgi:hypothetical protein